MDTNIIIIALIIIAGFVALFYFLNQKLSGLTEKKDDSSLLMLNQNLQGMQERLDKTTEQLQDQYRHSNEIIKDVTAKLTTLDATNRQVVGFAEQMKSLENILKNPKQRGILGEYMLETLLGNVLQPKQYKMQYPFKNGDIVDAVVLYNNLVVPIDAKFSLEKYNQMMQEDNKESRARLEKEFKADVKNRIDETSKYIRPEEGTTDFAIMFIPAEGIYYNLLIYDVGSVQVNAKDLVEYAFSKKVIIVSPTSFFAYLETVLQGLKALRIEESVKDIVANIHKLGKHLNAYEVQYKKLGSNLGTAVQAYNDGYREFGKIDKDVTKITGETIDSDILQIDKPSMDE